MGSTSRWNLAVAVALVVAVLSNQTEGQSNYCSLCSNHTLCIYSGISNACSQVLAREVSTTDQANILSSHNLYRNRVASGQETLGNPGPQPGASDMNKLMWDTELATVAQRWADQCSFGHDICRRVSRFSAVGQNVYQSWTTGTIQGPQWSSATKAWYDEVIYFSRNNVNSYVFDSQYGHYSQVVWGNTRYIGCGYTAYKQSGRNYQLYVCNYGPAGNYIGQRVYRTGTRCSNCTAACDTTYTSLCA